MSWDKYVSDQLIGTGGVSMAAICGLDGACWAKTAEWAITPAECLTIAKGFTDVSGLQMSGMLLAGTKYMFLSGTEDVLRGKKGNEGIHVTKTKSAVIIGLYKDPIQPAQCAVAVENLADYLKSQNY